MFDYDNLLVIALLLQRLPKILSVKMFNPHYRKVEIFKQLCIHSNLQLSEIRSVFALTGTHHLQIFNSSFFSRCMMSDCR